MVSLLSYRLARKHLALYGKYKGRRMSVKSGTHQGGPALSKHTDKEPGSFSLHELEGKSRLNGNFKDCKVYTSRCSQPSSELANNSFYIREIDCYLNLSENNASFNLHPAVTGYYGSARHFCRVGAEEISISMISQRTKVLTIYEKLNKAARFALERTERNGREPESWVVLLNRNSGMNLKVEVDGDIQNPVHQPSQAKASLVKAESK